MRPELFSILGFPIQSYGVSKALAAFVAAWLLGRGFARRGLERDDAHTLTLYATVWGFVGGKAYYIAEHAGDFTWHQFGGTGFTWYGGFLAGVVAFLVTARRRRLPLAAVTGLAAAPLSVAYGIGRLGCLLSGDGTYGRPSSLPWAMAFPDAMVPTTVPVQPTPLYEALAAFALAAVLWRMHQRWHPLLVVAAYLVGSGSARLLVELVRNNPVAALGMTQPQLWSIGLLAAGFATAGLVLRSGQTIVLRPAPGSLEVAGDQRG